MQEFEKPRYAEALDLFEKAFWDGFDRGERLLAAGDVERDPAVNSVEYVDVPRNNVLDGLFSGFAAQFGEAGFRAAVATRRKGRPMLDAGLSGPDDHEAGMTNRLRWCVILNPAPT